MKVYSDNRARAIQCIMKRIKGMGIALDLYEQPLEVTEFCNSKVVKNLLAFKQQADVMVTNRNTEALADVVDGVYIRDLFGGDLQID